MSDELRLLAETLAAALSKLADLAHALPGAGDFVDPFMALRDRIAWRDGDFRDKAGARLPVPDSADEWWAEVRPENRERAAKTMYVGRQDALFALKSLLEWSTRSLGMPTRFTVRDCMREAREMRRRATEVPETGNGKEEQ